MIDIAGQEFMVCGRRYRILKTTSDDRLMRNSWAGCDVQTGQILYRGDVYGDTLKEAIFHELVHASDMGTATESNQLVEEQVQRVSAVLFGVLREAPWLVEWLMGND